MSDTSPESVHPGFAVGAGAIAVGTLLEVAGLYEPLGIVVVLLGAAFLIEGEFRR